MDVRAREKGSSIIARKAGFATLRDLCSCFPRIGPIPRQDEASVNQSADHRRLGVSTVLASWDILRQSDETPSIPNLCVHCPRENSVPDDGANHVDRDESLESTHTRNACLHGSIIC